MSSTSPHVLVTGSTRGIGAAIVQALAERGVRIVGHGRSPGDNVLGLDLSAPGAGARLWEAALERLDGRIDILVNNAGIFEPAPVDLPEAEWEAAWDRTLQVNLRAAADLSRLAVRHFLERSEGGRIVNVASRAAYRGDSPQHWHYAASKAGMVAMTKSIARGFAERGVLAFAVCPGFTLTGMADDYLASRGGPGLLADIPLGRVADPAEVAAAVAFLALEAPASMTGAVLDINGASYVR
ncbi:MAG: hypothetical protein RL588_2598 [Pseudomonadota bacterium]|jgi:NAD(P)-dependent dehydrogenase (short-subunit alcohol dehydrogenase family)